MMLMALDHVRVFSGVPAGGPEPGVFLTRWVTHFCAPGFLFLAGVSAWLSMRDRSRAEVARTFLVRGLWLIALELTFLRVAWTFNFEFDVYLLAGVIWAIGWSMILMAGLVFLPRRALAALAVAVVAGHDFVGQAFLTGNPWGSPIHWFWRVLYAGGPVELGESGPLLAVLYSIVPWVGVMAGGFVFAPLLTLEPARRDRLCHVIGLTMIAAFVVLRATNAYGDPRPWTEAGPDRPAWMAFLNTTKYPASLSFLLMTLGPIIALMPTLERTAGRVSEVVSEFGRVPLFFYLLHIPLIHLTALLVALVRSPEAVPWMFQNHPILQDEAPPGYTYGLPLLYAVTAGVLVALFFACRWYARVRPRLPGVWKRLL